MKKVDLDLALTNLDNMHMRGDLTNFEYMQLSSNLRIIQSLEEINDKLEPWIKEKE